MKYFLSSFRALSDARSGIVGLEKIANSEGAWLSDWKLYWLSTCILIRSSIDLFQVDAKSCINPKIREEMRIEWSAIRERKEDHRIFWDFIRKERDAIIHSYEWSAYEAWIDDEGSERQAWTNFLDLKKGNENTFFKMRHGPYKGEDSIALLKHGADWAQERIFSAILRAGFTPDEERNMVSFALREARTDSLLTQGFSASNSGE